MPSRRGIWTSRSTDRISGDDPIVREADPVHLDTIEETDGDLTVFARRTRRFRKDLSRLVEPVQLRQRAVSSAVPISMASKRSHGCRPPRPGHRRAWRRMFDRQEGSTPNRAARSPQATATRTSTNPATASTRTENARCSGLAGRRQPAGAATAAPKRAHAVKPVVSGTSRSTCPTQNARALNEFAAMITSDVPAAAAMGSPSTTTSAGTMKEAAFHAEQPGQKAD